MEIRRLAAELARSEWASRWLLLPLHGELPPDQQRKVRLSSSDSYN